jgi:phosphorylcholine metabolism protein LicD
MKEYQLLGDFKYTVLKSFEGEMFCVCNGYDRLMRTKYGDYMQLPTEHQRKQKHGGSKFFWKNS